jgi:hypothetical protein
VAVAACEARYGVSTSSSGEAQKRGKDAHEGPADEHHGELDVPATVRTEDGHPNPLSRQPIPP